MCWCKPRLGWCALNMEAEATSQEVQATSGSWRRQGNRSSSRSSRKEQERTKVKSFSRVRLFATPWTVAYQAPPAMEFSKQEYWSGLPFPSPEDLPNPEIKPGSPALQAEALLSEPTGKPEKNRALPTPHLSSVRLILGIWTPELKDIKFNLS